MANYFEELLKLNVNDKTEKRKGDGGKELTYLSWSWAWAEFKKVYPDATYKINKYELKENNLEATKLVPYLYDENTGYLVTTEVTAGGLTYEMWLPVMNSNNKAMKAHSYDYTTKYGTKTVEPATMFDINKTIMRCLVKNLAMFGLGLYIYSGEDLPEQVEDHKNESFSSLSINTSNKVESLQKAPSIPSQNESLEEMIKKCSTEKELSDLYNNFKTQLVSNQRLLELVTAKGKSFKEVA